MKTLYLARWYRRLALSLVMLLLAAGLPGQSMAAYPEKPIKIVVPYSPGGTSDVITRILAEYLEKELGEKIIIVNINGGGGAVGWKQVQTSRADGYTLGVSVDSIAVMEATKATDFSYDSFEHIAMWGNVYLTVFASGTGPYKNMVDYREAAMAAPGKIGLAMGRGTPAQFIAALVAEGMGAELNLVNVGGGAQKKAAVLGGHVDAGIEPTPGVIGQTRAGQLRILGILAKERLEYLPEIPTAAEQGVDVEAFLSYGLMAPKGTPADRLDVIANAVAKVAGITEMQEKNQKVNFVWNYQNRTDYLNHLEMIRKRMLRIGKSLGY